jgi:hypothetical protein
MSVGTSVLCAINWCYAANAEAQHQAALASSLLCAVLSLSLKIGMNHRFMFIC